MESPEKKYVFAFRYCDCIYESVPYTISLHWSEEGAIKARRKHRLEQRRKWQKRWDTAELRKDFPFGEMQSWDVTRIQVQD